MCPVHERGFIALGNIISGLEVYLQCIGGGGGGGGGYKKLHVTYLTD